MKKFKKLHYLLKWKNLIITKRIKNKKKETIKIINIKNHI